MEISLCYIGWTWFSYFSFSSTVPVMSEHCMSLLGPWECIPVFLTYMLCHWAICCLFTYCRQSCFFLLLNRIFTFFHDARHSALRHSVIMCPSRDVECLFWSLHELRWLTKIWWNKASSVEEIKSIIASCALQLPSLIFWVRSSSVSLATSHSKKINEGCRKAQFAVIDSLW